MFEAGLVEEVKQLLPHKDRNALQTVGYRELFDYFEGKSTLEFAAAQIKQNTRRFAKRQMTWFKRTENAVWFDFETDRNKIIEIIKSKIGKSQFVNR
jgi:tRNA dimethylallyltransferase